jgi:hypothetical protein
LYFFSHLLIYVELNILMIMIGNQCLKLILKWVNMNKKNSIIAMVFMPEVYFSRKSNKNVIRRYQIYPFSTSYAYFNQTDDNDFLKFDLIILFLLIHHEENFDLVLKKNRSVKENSCFFF